MKIEPEIEPRRNQVYADLQGVMIVHVATRAEKDVDVHVYVIGHKNELEHVESIEYYLGHMWRHEVFKETSSENKFGHTFNAYAPFLVYAKINFKDGTHTITHRYADFEHVN